MESAAHRQLKRVGVSFLLRTGYQAVSSEVMCPIARFRLDVAGYRDGGAGAGPETVCIECKAMRADFLRDGRDVARLVQLRSALETRLRALEEGRIKRSEPELRRSGEYLFGDLETWDFDRTRLRAYHRVVARLARVDRLLHGETKFCRVSRYALADRMYLLAPRGLVGRREVPPGWGLLECAPRWHRLASLEPAALSRVPVMRTVAAPHHEPRVRHRHRLLRNIAVSATRVAARADGAEGAGGAAGSGGAGGSDGGAAAGSAA